MQRNDLIKALKELVAKSEIYAKELLKVDGDPCDWHVQADKNILEYLNDEEISELFDKIEKWYC